MLRLEIVIDCESRFIKIGIGSAKIEIGCVGKWVGSNLCVLYRQIVVGFHTALVCNENDDTR